MEDFLTGMQEEGLRIGEAVSTVQKAIADGATIDETPLGPLADLLDIQGGRGLLEDLLDTNSVIERFPVIIGFMRQMEDNAQRARLGDILFGGDSERMIAMLNRPLAEIDRIRAESVKTTGELTDDMIANLNSYVAATGGLGTAFNGVIRLLSDRFAPVLADIAERATRIAVSLRLDPQITAAFDNLGRVAGELASQFLGNERGVDNLAGSATVLGGRIASLINALAEITRSAARLPWGEIADGISTMVQCLANLTAWIARNTALVEGLITAFVGVQAIGFAASIIGATCAVLTFAQGMTGAVAAVKSGLVVTKAIACVAAVGTAYSAAFVAVSVGTTGFMATMKGVAAGVIASAKMMDAAFLAMPPVAVLAAIGAAAWACGETGVPLSRSLNARSRTSPRCSRAWGGRSPLCSRVISPGLPRLE